MNDIGIYWYSNFDENNSTQKKYRLLLYSMQILRLQYGGYVRAKYNVLGTPVRVIYCNGMELCGIELCCVTNKERSSMKRRMEGGIADETPTTPPLVYECFGSAA